MSLRAACSCGHLCLLLKEDVERTHRVRPRSTVVESWNAWSGVPFDSATLRPRASEVLRKSFGLADPRIRSEAKGGDLAETGEFRVGECIVNRARGQIMRPGGTAHLEPRAMDLLVALAERAGRTASRDELIEAVWGHPHVSDEALSRCVSLVRQALGDDRARPRFVETIPKRGYRLLAPVDGLSHGAEGDKTNRTAVAVLPFLNLSGDPGNEHIADGLTELLINNLASLPSLRVVSRTSSMHYKNTQARLTDIARELNVTRVVEGSVLRSERSLQVVVQLIDPATDLHMFTRTYTRDLADLLRLQNEIAWTVAGEIGASLEPGDRARLPLARPLPPDAGESYLRARHFWAQRTPESMAKAIQKCAT